MRLFKRKPRVTIEQLCQEFYDTHIFNASIRGIDVWKLFCQTAFDSIVEADQSFAATDRDTFQVEMTALRMELFALAWMRRFKREGLAVSQSLFTKCYLEEKGNLAIWDTMGEYNQAVARSATTTETGQQVAGPLGRGQVAFLNSLRFGVFKKWAQKSEDAVGDRTQGEEREELLNGVARVANRIGADIKRRNGILVKLLTARAADRLGCEVTLSFGALFRLAALIQGFYQGASEAIAEVDLVKS